MPMLQSIIASASKRATPERLRSTKAAIAICAALLSFLCLADDFVPKKLLIREWSSFGVESSSAGSQGAPIYNVSSEDDIFSILNTSTFGVCINSSRRDFNFGVVVPSFTTNVVFGGSVTLYSITNSVQGVIGGSSCFASVARFPRVASLFQSTAALYWNGYRGSGFKDIFVSGNKICVNVNYPLLYADVLSSTNTVFRQILLSHLSNISSTVGSIDTGVSALVPSVDRIADINSSLSSDYQAVNDTYLNPSYSNIAARAAYYNGLGGNGLSLENYLPDHPEQASEIAKAVLENSRKNMGYILNACRDPDSPYYGSSLEGILNDPEDFEKAISAGGGGSVLSQFVSDPQRATRAGDNFNKGVNDRLDGITSALVGSQGSDAPSIMGILGGGGSGGGGLAGDIKRLSTNDWASAVTNQLAENTAGITNRLAQNTRDIKDALANMFGPTTNDVKQIREDVHDNIEDIKNYNQRAAEASESIDRRLSDTIKVEVDGINVGFVLEEPVTIEQTQFNGISLPIAGISQRLEDWESYWLQWYNFDDSSEHWHNYYQMVARIESSITNLVSTNDWERYYFDRFKQADNFDTKDEQKFSIDDICERVFGNGFDIGEYNNLNWFSRVELLLYKVSSVTNTLETTDIASITNEVNTLNLNVTNFVNTSVKVVGVFKLIDGFAKSMRSAFSGSSTPLTSGVVLLEAGHWIGDEPLVLKVPIEVQNALRLVFECIWYLSAFVIGWRILVWSWDKIVSMIRWLWSLIDI